MTTRRERMEARAARRREWAAGRADKAQQTHDAEQRIGDAIPMGQPILVGHHSEQRARRDQARIRNLATKTAEHVDMRDRHLSRADGIERQLRTSIFSDDHDAIARLDAKLADLRAQRDRIKAYNATCRKGNAHGDLSLLDDHQRQNLVGYFQHWPAGLKDGRWPSLTNLSTKIRTTQQRRDALANRAET